LANIDVNNAKLSFNVDDEHIEFNLIKGSKFPSMSGECHWINVMDSFV